MLEMIRRHIVVPLMGRMGTMAATALMPYVASPDLRVQIGVGVTAFGLVAFDLFVGYVNRTALANKVFADTVEGILKGRGE